MMRPQPANLEDKGECVTDRLPRERVDQALRSLLQYCQDNDWAGYDPYDALNSTVFRVIPFFQNKFCRIAFTQAMKRSPVNLRPLLGIRKEQNPKALALFATALLRLPHKTYETREVLQRLIHSKSPGRPYACWGYNFPWQNRVALVPRGEPNIICTTFAGNALLDAYEKYHDPEYLHTAVSASEFLLHGLHIAKYGDEICFSYTPRDHEQVHNANLLGAAYLARVYQHAGNSRLLEYAVSAGRFSVSRQAPDGSWPYGEGLTQRWIDNFHTGFNLIALRRLAAITHRDDFKQSVHRGFEFYRQYFFEDTGVVRYYHNRTYPIDIHAIAQSIITLVEHRYLWSDALSLAYCLFQWASEHMHDTSGYYYFQRGRLVTNKIAHMRWSQAWMLLALVNLAEVVISNATLPENRNTH